MQQCCKIGTWRTTGMCASMWCIHTHDSRGHMSERCLSLAGEQCTRRFQRAAPSNGTTTKSLLSSHTSFHLSNLHMTAALPRPFQRERASSTCSSFGFQRYCLFFSPSIAQPTIHDQSTMPLAQFVHMIHLLARHSAPPPGDVHPLHPALDDILLTGNWCSYKYEERLLQHVVDVHASSGADLETSIMLFVLERYALCGDPQSEPGDQQQQIGRACSTPDDKKRSLSGIEKRE